MRREGDVRLLAHRMELTADPAAVFAALFGSGDHPWWLDSAATGPDVGRFSYLGSADGPLARVVTADYGRNQVVLRDATGTRLVPQHLFDFLADDLGEAPELPTVPFDFRLGWVGHLGYELGARTVTADAPHPVGGPDETPEAVLVFADRMVVVDHGSDAIWVVALTDEPHRDVQQAWLDDTVDRLYAGVPALPAPEPFSAIDAAQVTVRHGREEYLRLIEDCREHIAAGDSYELCLTNRITVHAATDPWQLYRRLRETSPRPFGAYLAFDRGRVLSASPERFLSVDRAGWVEARPIKGTRGRGATPEEDRRLAAELATDEKERAENLMIVDLLRNDLGRVCRTGTVHVPKLFDVETHTGVHHLVSTVRGRLTDGVRAVDAVRVAFPGGSMTGAPKYRAIQLLAGLEAGPRGVYSGAVGYFSLDGAADWSIVIRTLVWHPDHLTYGIGGAITAGSDPAAEWRETTVKARTLGAVLEIDLDPVLDAAQPAAAHSHHWDGATLQPRGGEGDVLVADSWRSRNGRTRLPDAHRERFVTAVHAAAPQLSIAEVTAFFSQAVAAVPATGEWFPRVRLLGGEVPQLLVDVRPGPPRVETARVQVLPVGDPRRAPLTKGPDLAASGRLIAAAPAEEVLFRDADGVVLEAGWAAVVWWREDTLCLPDPELAVLPSVTRQWVVGRARRLGHPVQYVTAKLAELDGCEAWLLNAYQGVRLVTAWLDTDITPGPGLRFAGWRDAWLSTP